MYTFEGRIRYSETDSEGKLTMARNMDITKRHSMRSP